MGLKRQLAAFLLHKAQRKTALHDDGNLTRIKQHIAILQRGKSIRLKLGDIGCSGANSGDCSNTSLFHSGDIFIRTSVTESVGFLDLKRLG